MIVGTAGHIDHGKTTLVRALTGVDTDRLPEEKRRGISIELGYAYLDVPDAAAAGAPPACIGFVDVPGHERLVTTMVAGATGIDFALLVVAADDGVMPQTREHLAVLALLGLARGAVVVTKADRASDERIAEVVAEVRALLAPTPLAAADVRVVSAATGRGLDDLKALLFAAARRTARRDDPALGFRLAVDRAFTLAGTGTVVTGTAHAGTVRVGDTLVLVPQPPPAAARTVRVRSLHAQNTPVGEAHAGQRVALGLAGVAKEEVDRGQWLVDPAVALQTDRLDAAIVLWHGEDKPLRSGSVVQVHLGAASVLASVAVLDLAPADAGTSRSHGGAGDGPEADAGARAPSGRRDDGTALHGRGAGTAPPGHDGGIAGAASEDPAAHLPDAVPPGRGARVQLVLRRPVAAWHGDRLVLRDATRDAASSAGRMLAGGRVLDPFAPSRQRRTPVRLALLDARQAADAAARLRALLRASPHGIDLDAWRRAEGRSTPAVPDDGVAVRARDGAAEWAIDAGHGAALRQVVVAALAQFHARQPEELGPDRARLRRLAAPKVAPVLWQALVAAWIDDGTLALRGARLHLPEHAVRLTAADERIAQKVMPLLDAGGLDPPWVRDLAAATRESEPLLRTVLARLAQRGDLHAVVKDLYYPARTVDRAAALARRIAAAHDDRSLTVAEFRDASGLGRKRAIQIVEFLDRAGLLRRVGDRHRLRPDAAPFGEGGVS